jgi:hypothetical protein
MRIADNHAAIRDRIEELEQQRREDRKGRRARDWKDDEDDQDRNLVEQVKKILGRGRLRD